MYSDVNAIENINGSYHGKFDIVCNQVCSITSSLDSGTQNNCVLTL